MSAFLYGLFLQFRLDIRSKALLITCYLVPLLFFALMGGIFTSVDPNARQTLIPSMSVFVVTMGAMIGLPPQLAEIYGSDIRKVYSANGIPLYIGVLTHFLSAFLHLCVVCLIVFAVAPVAFGAPVPADLPRYFSVLVLLIAVSLSVGCAFGVCCKSQSKLTMYTQLAFLPSILLSGILFPSAMLPEWLQPVGFVFPATAAYGAMTDLQLWQIPALFGILCVMCGIVALRLNRFAC